MNKRGSLWLGVSAVDFH